MTNFLEPDHMSPQQRAVYSYLLLSSRGKMTTSELVQETGMTPQGVRQMIGRLQDIVPISRPERGVFEIPAGMEGRLFLNRGSK